MPELETYLQAMADLPDEEINLAEAALMLAAAAQPGISLDRYLHHFDKLLKETVTKHHDFLAAGAEDNAETRLAALKDVIVTVNGYKGDQETYDDLQNASLIRVIERRKGLPVALAILYIHTGLTLGWDICGLNFPGHFLCRLELMGRRIIFDPFYDCKIMEAHDLRLLVKKFKGDRSELSASYYERLTNRQILIRLQNNIKYRQIEMEDYADALETVKIMRLTDPGEFRLLLDAGVLYTRTGEVKSAIAMLETYLSAAPPDIDRHDAILLLRELKEAQH